MTPPRQHKPVRSVLVTALTVVVLVSLVQAWRSGLGVAALWDTVVREYFFAVVLVVVPLLIAAMAALRPSARTPNEATWLPDDADGGGEPAAKKGAAKKGAASIDLHRPVPWLLCFVAALGVGYGIFVHPYLVGRSYPTTQAEEVTDFAERAPWVVANNFAMRDQGDVIGDRENVRFVPAASDGDAAKGEGSSRYGVLVKERGPLGFGGYEAVQTLNMPTTGPIPGEASSFCSVPEEMNKRLDTFWPWHSLSWSIHAQRPTAHFTRSDAYGYCAGDTPVVVVPLYRYEGFWAVRKAPAGAAVYTPEGLSVVEDIAPEIEGPTYPLSLAAKQREAINAGGSLADWWGSRYGYDLTDKDEEDTNQGNESEFLLVRPDKTTAYVSPLTPRGSSQSITAISVVPGRQDAPELKPVVINAFPDLPATSTLATSIKESSVHGDSAWTTRWASGMTVYEILPGRDGHWVASIGQGQAVSYRADIAPDGTITVVNEETGQSSGGAGSAGGAGVTVDAGRPLAEMSPEELLSLIADATAELQSRQAAS
ncbi:hypothetical protein [Corynebacterium uterequi]|nr:hypothetical protein [Corynebacterium uterequi]